jgi:hypothetical protein
MAKKTAVKKRTQAPRASYKRVTKADRMREAFKDLDRDDLMNFKKLKGICNKFKIKAVDTDIYRIRGEAVRKLPLADTAIPVASIKTGLLQSGRNPAPNGDGRDLLKDIMTVKKAAEQVGGMASLKNITSIIERVRQ